MNKCILVGKLNIKGQDIIKRVYSPEGISLALTTMQGGNRQPKIIEENRMEKITAAAMRGRYVGDNVEQQIEISDREYSNAITTVQKDSLIAERKSQHEKDKKQIIRNINKNAKHQQDLVQCSTGICKTIPAGTHGSTPHLLKTVIDYNPLKIRKLTPKECWRLMGFEDTDFEKAEKVCSNTQLYKQAGNSIVVDVLENIFKSLTDAEVLGV